MSAVTIFNIILGILFAGIIVLQILLNRTVRRSLYYYRNVAYIAGIIYGTVLLLALYDFLISCLTDENSMNVHNIFVELLDFPKDFIGFTLPVFIVICSFLLISNLSLIKHEGLRTKNILGVFFSLLFIGGTVLITVVCNKMTKYVAAQDSDLLQAVYTGCELFLVLAFCYLEVFFLATVILGFLAARQKPLHNKDFIIILGCSVDKKGGLRPLLRDRTNAAIRYAWNQEIECGRRVRFVPTGGQGPGEVISEGSAMEIYLLAHGAEEGEIYAEKKSRNTYENFLFSKEIIDKEDKDSGVCFATTNYHMFRSGLLAKRIGFKNIEGVAGKTKWYFWPNGFAREFIAILAMEKKFHTVSIVGLLLVCSLLGVISYLV